MSDQGVYVLLKVLVLPLGNMPSIILADMSFKKTHNKQTKHKH